MKKKTKIRKKNKDWFKLKKYPHIGLPLKRLDKNWIEKYVQDKDKIKSHAFFPFIHRRLKVRKYRRKINIDGTRSKERVESYKSRDIYFSNHLDSNIYSYYAELLSRKYEEKLIDYGIEECVTGYRRIKLLNENRNKCNIDFANDVFTYIKQQKNLDVVAITFDIKSFFDSLNHKLLKKYWCIVLGSDDSLPPDHYNIFRNITKFSYVEENDIFLEFQDRIIVKKSTGNKEKTVKQRKYLRNQGAIAYCENKSIEELRSKNLIKANKYFYKDGQRCGLRDKGIPQGSPISAVLANVYMLDFDKIANELLQQYNGVYRRYSDDMVVISKAGDEEKIRDYFHKLIRNFELEIQDLKTQVFYFQFDSTLNHHKCFEKNLNTKKLQNNTKFEYLGFQFDGKNILLKNSSLAGYYRKMKFSLRIGEYYAYKYRKNYTTQGEIFKNRLYKKFTYIGAIRRRMFERDLVRKNKFNLTCKYDWGNFITYAKMAAKIMKEDKILKQINRHWNIFHKLLKDIEIRNE